MPPNQRDSLKEKKCSQCFFSEDFCLCQDKQKKIELPFRLIFVMNKSEFFKLSNSARLYLLNCSSCEIRIRGLKNSPFKYEEFSESLENSENYLLYPDKNAKEAKLEDLLKEGTKKKTLIIPDGNWSQAAKIAHKLKEKENISPIALKAPPNSKYLLRKNPNADRVSTFEATFLAIERLLKENEKKQLTDSFQRFVKQILILRGKLPRKTP